MFRGAEKHPSAGRSQSLLGRGWRRVSSAGLHGRLRPTIMTARTLAGRCWCGAIRYTVLDEFRYAANCHCSNCRRATGSAFKPFAGIERAKLTVAHGADSLLILGNADCHDARCRACGSLLYSVVGEGKTVHLALGSLLDTPSVTPSKHIFVGSKAPWFTIGDDLPQHEEF